MNHLHPFYENTYDCLKEYPLEKIQAIHKDYKPKNWSELHGFNRTQKQDLIYEITYRIILEQTTKP